MSLFAVIYRPGKTWISGVAFQQQVGVFDHRAFLADQHQVGSLVLGGPFLDDSGGLSVFEADTEVALKTLLDRDPTVQRELLTYEHHPFQMCFSPSQEPLEATT